MGGFFDPASFKEVLVAAPVNSAGCTYADYNGAWDVSDKVVLVAGDTALCDFGVKVMLAQTQGAVGVILYGDGIPAGSQSPGRSTTPHWDSRFESQSSSRVKRRAKSCSALCSRGRRGWTCIVATRNTLPRGHGQLTVNEGWAQKQ